jgi:predicted AlkP superfamily pyrophosphatase or phosphodiesterase
VRALAVALLALVAVACAAVAPRATTASHVVLVSIDALRPEFYLDPAFEAPTLRALVAEGSHARGAESVFPTLTYPAHASLATGVRPARHGIAFNFLFDRERDPTRWYEEAVDLRAPPIWTWARAAGLTTAAVNWPATLGAPIDWLLPERDYWARPEPLPLLVAASTPGLFTRLGVSPDPGMFRDAKRWDAFVTATAAGILRDVRPHLLLLHLVEADLVQHQAGRAATGLPQAVARLDGHLATLRQAVADAGIADRTTIIVTGDHGMQDVREYVYPNHVLARAGLRACPRAPGWRATAHVAAGSAAVFVDPPGDADVTARATQVLREAAGDRYTIVSRAALDALGAMTGAAFALEATPGWAIGSSCDRGLTEAAQGGPVVGTHGFLPSRASMTTGFLAAGAGVRRGVALERIRIVDVAPTAAHLLGVSPPPVDGRVLVEILEGVTGAVGWSSEARHPSGRAIERSEAPERAGEAREPASR